MGEMSQESKDKAAATRKKNKKDADKLSQELAESKAETKAAKAALAAYKRGMKDSLDYLKEVNQ